MQLLLNFLVLVVIPSVPAIEFVHTRSGPFGQLITSNTLHWTKASQAKDPVTVPTSEDSLSSKLCHILNGPRRIGLLEDGKCKLVGQDGKEDESSSYQLLSGHASRIKWSHWIHPKAPPAGAVALLQDPNRFIVYDPDSGSVGSLEYSKTNIGKCVFPSGPKPHCLILTEIEPTGYQLTEIELKRGKGFKEEPVILATTTLPYIEAEDNSQDLTRSETVLTYRLTNQYDNWGQGILMAKGLHTTVKLPGKSPSDSNVQIIEWGLPSVQTEKVVAQPVWADLHHGTGVNITIRGLHLKGDMTYWATLKTFYKDETFATRHIEGHRKVDQVEGITVEQSLPFYLRDGSLVTESTTLATTTTTSTTPVQTTEMQEQQDMTSPLIPIEEQQIQVERTENLRIAKDTIKNAIIYFGKNETVKGSQMQVAEVTRLQGGHKLI
ncbi:unnamed protein product [Allacma fusca]|uniref:Uncharacterized protein n=1 Tax=Allacma fusca TaxID=39272 RepID=A0A8J2KDM2_9HEXA|nr:unnamed protein product [Allacma fusca]